jgi:hypothetical protein
MKISAITCTTDERKEAFALCKGYVARQTRPPDQHLVLDGSGAMHEKLADAIRTGLIKGDAVLFTEDDDWFAPTWFAWCEAQLEKGYDIVGEGCAQYYNVNHRWWSNCGNVRHASLCQTAIRAKLLPQVYRIIEDFGCPWIDVQLWNLDCNKILHLPKDGKALIVGIKGMCSKGYSREHRQINGPDNNIDYDLEKLRSWIGGDADRYAQYFHGEDELLRLAGAL